MAKRSSKFRHIYGEEVKPENTFQELKNPLTSGEGSYVKANAKFFAVARAAGGGPLYIRRLNDPGRFAANAPTLSVHKGKVWDFDFHPFISNIIATGSDDTHVAVAQFPAGGLEDNVTDAMIDMQGHQKKVILVTWHPSANNILATGSFDRTVKVWNVETGEALSTYDGLGDNIYSLEWNRDGSMLGCTSKDRKLRLYDPRNKEKVIETEAFDGAKSSKLFFVPEFQWVGATGFSKSAKRQLKLWDSRKIEEPLFKLDIDAAASVLMPNFDTDNGVLYLAGKGDGTIQFYELVNDGRQVYFLNHHRGEPQKGGGWVPKRGLDVWKCEVNRFLKLTKTSVIPVSFIVPRKAGGEVFQDDIYPDAPAPKAAMTADQWASGQNADPVLMSLDPAKRQDKEDEAQGGFEKKASYAELAEENRKLKAALAAAKAELAKLKGEPAAEEKEEEPEPEQEEENQGYDE